VPLAAHVVRAEASAGDLTATVFAKAVAEAAETGAAYMSVADASAAEAPRSAVTHALGDTSVSVATAKQGKNMVVGNPAATRNCCCHCQCPSTLFLRCCAKLGCRKVFATLGI